MPNRFILTRNAQFYTSKQDISNEIVSDIFEAASANKEPDSDFLIDEIRAGREKLDSDISDKAALK